MLPITGSSRQKLNKGLHYQSESVDSVKLCSTYISTKGSFLLVDALKLYLESLYALLEEGSPLLVLCREIVPQSV